MGLSAWAQGYKQASPEIRRILDAPAPAQISVNPTRTHALLVRSRLYPPVAELGEPMLRLAGLRINPRTRGPHRGTTYVSLELKRLDPAAAAASAVTALADVPADAHFSAPRWSPDGKRFAITNAAQQGTELWIGVVESGEFKKVEGVAINAAHGEPIEWWPDSRELLVKLVTQGTPPAPAGASGSSSTGGPSIQESAGRAGPVRTYQDMLTSPADEALLEYYATSQLAFVDTASGAVRRIGKPAMYESADPAPDSRHLLIHYQHRPFSYVLPVEDFPTEVEVWTKDGALVKKLASLPMRERVPIQGVPTGPRNHAWRPTEPATVVWIEALDGGDPKTKAAHRDRLIQWRAPFTGEPKEFFRTEHRFSGLRWLERNAAAMVSDYDRDRRWTRTQLIAVDAPSPAPRTIWSRSIQDRYGDPGTPLQKTLANGHRVVRQEGEFIFLESLGATPQGDRPFLDRLHLGTLKPERLFRSDADSYEVPVTVLDTAGSRILTRRETPTEPPHYVIRTAAGATALTAEKDPAPQLRQVKKELVRYKRGDGVDLSFTLYLPPGYQAGTRLPTVVWAYPLEYNDAATAGQVSGSTKRFTTVTGASHLYYLLAGYAVLDGATMPVVGTPETVNNNYLEQIVMSAKAAIQKATEMGVTDPKRVGVGGHSYGAFMTANLLAHSDLFRAGVARSGAYNRTLTPFGFQSERRTLWEASDTYLRMSPFLHADKIKEPVLLIHGEADNNTGTFPIQSDRMYQAIRGNGGTVRLVMLPHESHGYVGRESVEHTIAEMIEWFDRHVKPAI